MTSGNRISCFWVFICLLSIANGLYFYVSETEKKCFIEDLPEETMVVGKYKVELLDENSKQYVPTTAGLGMHVDIRDPDEAIILSRTYATEGRFTFTSHSSGEHTICMYTNSTAWFGGAQLKVTLSMEIGEHANDYPQIAAQEKLSDIDLRMRQLVDQIDQINKEQSYQRTREERFRQTSESTNERVLYWSLAQTVVLLALGFWQMRHLKHFFETKKLV